MRSTPSLPTAALWVLSRVTVVLLLFGPERRSVADVGYFAEALRHLSAAGLDDTLREYPLPAVGVVSGPWLVARALGALDAYGFLFVLGALLTDAAFTCFLSRQADDRRRPLVVNVWLLAVPAMGGLSYARFDLVPGVLMGCCILLSARRPRLAALAVSVATSVKLWPVLLIPSVLARTRHQRRGLAVVAATGAVTALGTLVLAGWARVLSPLGYQADRGLQIESVPASPLMLGRALDVAGYDVSFSRHMAYEITGPGASVTRSLTTVATIGLVVFLAVLWRRLLRAGGPIDGDALVWTCLAVTVGFMCSGKVLSPQYFLWLLPMAAAGLAVVTGTGALLLRWTWGLLAATVLSHAIFPWLYDSLLAGGTASDVAAAVLLVRNVLTMVLFWAAARRALRLTATQCVSEGTGTGSWWRERQTRSSSTVSGTAVQGASTTSEPS